MATALGVPVVIFSFWHNIGSNIFPDVLPSSKCTTIGFALWKIDTIVAETTQTDCVLKYHGNEDENQAPLAFEKSVSRARSLWHVIERWPSSKPVQIKGRMHVLYHNSLGH